MWGGLDLCELSGKANYCPVRGMGNVRVRKVNQLKCLGFFPLAASYHVYAAVINTEMDRAKLLG